MGARLIIDDKVAALTSIKEFKKEKENTGLRPSQTVVLQDSPASVEASWENKIFLIDSPSVSIALSPLPGAL